jgi:hypothetical protein
MTNPCNLRICIFLAVILLIVCPPIFAQTALNISFTVIDHLNPQVFELDR